MLKKRKLTQTAFNLIEITLLILPFEWWLPTPTYARLNDVVMGILYSPLLLVVGMIENRDARRIRRNRRRGEDDEDRVQEWELLAEEVEFEVDDGWKENVRASAVDVLGDPGREEVLRLREEVRALTEVVKGFVGREKEGEGKGSGSGSGSD